jgi:hypothetical protein
MASIFDLFGLGALAAIVSAATPNDIVEAYAKNSVLALEQFDGEKMEFSGTVVSCTRAPDNKLWTVRIDAGKIDVIGNIRNQIQAGQKLRLSGTCAKIRKDHKVVVTLEKATAEADSAMLPA